MTKENEYDEIQTAFVNFVRCMDQKFCLTLCEPDNNTASQTLFIFLVMSDDLSAYCLNQLFVV